MFTDYFKLCPSRGNPSLESLGFAIEVSLNKINYKHDRLFAGSSHMVRNKLCWDTNNAVELQKQRNSYQSSLTFLGLKSPTALFASQCNLFRTMLPNPAKGLLANDWLTTEVSNSMEWHADNSGSLAGPQPLKNCYNSTESNSPTLLNIPH